MTAAEPSVVVGNREHLWWLLAEAATLEHMIMCQYLFAEFSLKTEEDGLIPEQAEAVDRWRKTIRGIAVEEMLHLALVGNLMSVDRRRARRSADPTSRSAPATFRQRTAAGPAAVRRAGAAPLPVPRTPRGHAPPGRRGLRADRSPARSGRARRTPAAGPGVHDRRSPVPGHRRRPARARRAPRRTRRVRRLPAGPGDPRAVPLAAAHRRHGTSKSAHGRRRGDHRAGRGCPRRLEAGPLRPVPGHVGGVPRHAGGATRRSSRPGR